MANNNTKAGGQAVIEGVMMIVEGGYAMSVRNQKGEIITEKKQFKKYTELHKSLNVPFVRGIVSFIEMMILGFESINKSADIAYGTESKNTLKENAANFAIILFSLIIGFGIFFFVPIQIGTWIGLKNNQALFNLFTGFARFLFFIIYIVGISFIKDIKRVFMYHGAEHKTIFAFEGKEELKVENVRKYSTKHPRCGTSFIFITLISAIIFYAIIDTIVFSLLGVTNIPVNRFINHMIFLPLVAAISYELLMLSGKYYKNPIVRLMILPGLWFQYITTKEPTDEMIEVAITSLTSALEAAGTEK